MPPASLPTPRSEPAIWARGDAPYPEQLNDLPDPPEALYAFGDATVLDRPVVVIVGTRRSSAYGERVTRGLTVALARAGACVVSGLAVGIDAAAHRAALDVGGASCAVMGTGIDVVYPRANRRLCQEIKDRGLVLSEYGPGVTARKWSFPRRNRILAGLARLTIVVEAARTSGALVTAGVAIDLGRTVAAVPGPVDAPESVGTNALIRDGAAVITDACDALVLAGLTPWAGAAIALTPDETAVRDALGDGPAPADIVTLRSRLPAARCLAALTALQLAGLVAAGFDGVFSSI